ncbi:MAG: aminotransferase class I/II-fold pyridoxal phosphate-dependent enzyme [Acidimicrobiia bacterium]|nr:aminotransferase class I/II-fold pyridoxal phosphate-dependent enzyme [Acidimicrobiia bacterium]
MMQTDDCSEQTDLELIDRIVAAVSERTPVGIARAVGRLVSSGEAKPGDRLPTVRALAAALSVSPTSVAEAWLVLRQSGTIDTGGRRGTFVREAGPAVGTGRIWRVPVEQGVYELDLSTGTPDPDLLPSLGSILRTLGVAPAVTSYLDRPVLEALERVLLDRWPFPAERLTVVNGAMDALDRLVSLLLGFGDRVVVENPTFAPIIDLLERSGAEIISVRLDAEGIVPDSLADALALQPGLLVMQPRAHNPTGIGTTEARAAALAGLLADTGTLIIEDDHSGVVSGAPLHSLGTFLPERVVHIHSFSKAYGPDLRLAAVGGAAGPIDELIRRRQLGPSWSSRLLQSVLLQLLTDPAVDASLAMAASTYGERRRRLSEALAGQGVEIGPGSGLNVWLPVREEQWALVALASRGVGAAPGSPFQIDGSDGPHLRITTARVHTGFNELAVRLADAARAAGSRSLPA